VVGVCHFGNRNVIFWLPTFVLDFALYGIISTDVLGYINLGVNLTIFYALARAARSIVAWFKRRLLEYRRANERNAHHHVTTPGLDDDDDDGHNNSNGNNNGVIHDNRNVIPEPAEMVSLSSGNGHRHDESISPTAASSTSSTSSSHRHYDQELLLSATVTDSTV
jgi:hypothetical protein